MLNLTLKNIPKELHALLKESAGKNRRSLNSEILVRLESDFAAPVVDPEAQARTLKAFAARLPRVEHAKVSRYKRQGRGVIVVDTNVVAYCWVNGPMTQIAQRVRIRDPEWHVPFLWRSEMRSILAGYFRDRSLTGAHITRIMAAAEEALAGCEHLVPSAGVFELVRETRLSAYDCEFVALASVLSVLLVTADKAVLKAFPGRALTMEQFVRT